MNNYNPIVRQNIEAGKCFDVLADRAAAALGMTAAALRGAGRKRALELVRARLREIEGIREYLNRQYDDLVALEAALGKAQGEAAA